ncbi:fibronectin type III domain-containing protein [Phytohabitans sp. LJ34]|uniref:fibronectin type III domain-containing protein n=1 Tax=Phytohabitans sp. LJ34 TaxID=3452217 RepID=UPI003F89DEE1
MSIPHRRTRSTVIGLALAACAVLVMPATAAVAGPPDRVPPTVPTDLRVHSVGFTWVSLAWNPSTDNSGTVLYDATLQAAGGPLQQRAFTPTQGFGGLTPGTTYTASVRAVDLAGNASAAVSVQASTPARTLPPPTTPTNLRGVHVGGVLDRIAWDASPHGTPVSYLLLSGETVLSSVSTTSVSVFQLVHVDCAVEPGGTYTLTVRALSADGDFSDRSAPLTVTIPIR